MRVETEGTASHPATLPRPSLCQTTSLEKIRGRRECRAPDTHPRFRVKKTHESSPQVRRTIPAFPARRCYGLFRALPGDRAFLSPYPAQCKALSRENASVETSGPHGFAVRPRRARLARQRRPSLPASNVRDDRETPLLIGHGMGRILPVIWRSDQPQRLRPINTTGKSGARAEIVSSDRQLLLRPCPGRGASRSGAAQIRDPRYARCRDDGPRISSAPRRDHSRRRA
jgi:hypothetical protein